jgi:hypothetical protein
MLTRIEFDVITGESITLDLTAEELAKAQATTTAAQAAAALLINPDGFVQSVKTAVGGILSANALMIAYPAFFPAIQEGQWTDLQTLIIDANTKAVITPLQYAEIRQAATDNHIPITLP